MAARGAVRPARGHSVALKPALARNRTATLQPDDRNGGVRPGHARRVSRWADADDRARVARCAREQADRPRGDSLTFAYSTTLASPLVQATIPLAAGSNAVTSFTPVETRGLQGTAAVALWAANTKVDGPRTDVGDTTEFWLTALGAPNRTRDALGNETLIAFGNSTFPGLATRIEHANGQIVAAAYDSLGHVKAVTDSTTFDPSPLRYATTSYTWDPPGIS